MAALGLVALLGCTHPLQQGSDQINRLENCQFIYNDLPGGATVRGSYEGKVRKDDVIAYARFRDGQLQLYALRLSPEGNYHCDGIDQGDYYLFRFTTNGFSDLEFIEKVSVGCEDMEHVTKPKTGLSKFFDWDQSQLHFFEFWLKSKL